MKESAQPSQNEFTLSGLSKGILMAHGLTKCVVHQFSLKIPSKHFPIQTNEGERVDAVVNTVMAFHRTFTGRSLEGMILKKSAPFESP